VLFRSARHATSAVSSHRRCREVLELVWHCMCIPSFPISRATANRVRVRFLKWDPSMDQRVIRHHALRPNISLLSRPASTNPSAHHRGGDATTTRGRPGVKGGRWTNRGRLGSAGTTFAMGFESRRQLRGGSHQAGRKAVAGRCEGCVRVWAGPEEQARRAGSRADRVREAAARSARRRRGQGSPLTGRGSASRCRSRRSCAGS